MPDTDFQIYDKKMLTQLKNEQSIIPAAYTSAPKDGVSVAEIEQKSADFLRDFSSGKIILTEDARAVMPEYLEILKLSSYPLIGAYLDKAENKFKAAVITQKKQKELHIDKENLDAKQFAILHNKKKMEQLSSTDLLLIADLLEAETGYSTTNLKNKLESYVHNRIRKVQKGELETDEDFSRLVKRFGTYQQREVFDRQTPKVNPSVPLSSLEPKPETSHPLDLTPPVSETIINEKPIIFEEKPVIVDVPKEEDLSKNKREAILDHKKAARKEFLSANNFAILQSKNRLAALSSEDLLLLDEALKETLENTKKNTRPYNVLKRQQNILSTFAQSKIEKVFSGQAPADENFEQLVTVLGNYKQQDTLRNKGVPVFEESSIEKPEVFEDKKKVKTPEKEESDTDKKEPWYARLWQKTRRAAIIVGVAAISLFGFGKFAQSLSNSSPEQTDNKPTTELTVDNQQENIQQTEIQPEVQPEIQPEVQVAAPVSEQVQTDTTQVSLQKALDAKYNIILQSFKESQDTLGINMDNLDKVVSDGISSGKIELSDTLTQARAKYMIAFYAQYPGSDAGNVCKALLDGENVDFSKEDFKKWDNELGRFGSKFTKSLGKTTNYSPIDHASEQTKKDYKKTNQDFMKILAQMNGQTH